MVYYGLMLLNLNIMPRYEVTTTFFINAKSDEDAVFKAKYIAARQSRSKDDNCTVVGVSFNEEEVIRVIYHKDQVITITKPGGPAWDDPTV